MASPQVITQEFDLSTRVAAFPGMYGLIIFAANRGRPGQRTMVTGSQQLDAYFGTPKIGSDIGYYLVHTFLSKSRRCWVVRVCSDDALYGGVSVGAKFSNPIGFGNSVQNVFSGFVPFNRCHPGTVEIYIDQKKVGYDNGKGVINGIGINAAASTVNYYTGEVNVEFASPIPNRAVVYARWGLANAPFSTGMLDPMAYNFDQRTVLQDIGHTAKVYSDKLVPDMLVSPEGAVTGVFDATVRIYDGADVIAFVDEDGTIMDIDGSHIDTTQPHTVDMKRGTINFTIQDSYTPVNPLRAEFRSYKSELMVIAADNPGSWADTHFLFVTNIDPINHTFDLTIYERDSRGIDQRIEQFSLSRKHQLDGFERQMYVEDRVNNKSHNIRIKDNINLEETEALPDESIVQNSVTTRELYQLAGGTNGTPPTVSAYINELKKFNNKEDVKVDIVVDTLGDRNYHIEIAKLCDRQYGGRADCYGVLYTPFELEENTNYVDMLVNYRKYDLNLTTSFAGLYCGHVKIYDAYNGRELYIPNSGFVGAAFSYTADQYEPWFPAAGWRRGVLPVIDVYRRFTLGERDVLYDNDINPIRYRPGKGIAIWGQKTLYGRASSLDRANVRWLLIVVENAIEEFLEEFEFELNDSHTRSIIRAGVNDYLEGIKNRRGLYDYEVVCDDTNNSAESIDQYQLYMDFYVKPVKSSEYIFSRAIITRTGVNFADVRLAA